jgi:hypothetical protein
LPPEDPPPVPPPPRREDAVASGVRHEGPWLKYLLPGGLGHIIWNHDARSLDGHCPLHKNCRMNRTVNSSSGKPGQGRPMGQIIAWLRDGPNHTSAAAHGATKRSEVVVSWPLRVAAREWVSTLPGIEVMLEKERPCRDGERQEPFSLPG